MFELQELSKNKTTLSLSTTDQDFDIAKLDIKAYSVMPSISHNFKQKQGLVTV